MTVRVLILCFLVTACNPLVPSSTTESGYNPGSFGGGSATPVPVASIVLTSTGPTVIAANGVSTINLIATVSDSGGNPLSGIVVSLNHPNHGGSAPSASTISGVATLTLTSSTNIGVYAYTASARVVTSAPINVTFGGVLDQLSINVGAAYSLRRLKGSYTGPCLQVDAFQITQARILIFWEQSRHGSTRFVCGYIRRRHRKMVRSKRKRV